MKRIIIYLLSFMVFSSFSVNAATIMMNPKFHAEYSGEPVGGGLLYTYIAGTTTAKSTYTDRDAGTPNSNPVVLDSNGDATVYGTGSYKFVLYTDPDGDGTGDTLIWTMDNLRGINETAFTTIGDYDDDFDAAITAIGSTRMTLYVDDDASMSANTTVPSTCTVKVLKGGVIDQGGHTLNIDGPLIMEGGTITNDGTLTISSSFEAGLYQIFTDTGTVSFDGGVVNPVYPEWWYSSGSWDTAIEYAIQSLTPTYSDSLTAIQGGTVKLGPKVYTVTDTITISKPVKLSGSSYEISTGTTRGAASGTRITSNINDGTKDVIELVGNSVISDVLIGTTLENFAINGADTERDGIRVSADGYIYRLHIRNINIYDVSNNGITVTSDNDTFSYSTIENVQVTTVGNDSFNLETGYASDETVGLRLVDCVSHNATRYGLYIGVKGLHVDNFTEDFSGIAGIYMKDVSRVLITNSQVEQGSGFGLELDGSSHCTFINLTSTNNTDSQIYLTGSATANKFIGCHLNQTAAEKHIEYDSGCRNNLWIGTTFYETPDITDSGTRNVYFMNYDSTNTTEPGLNVGSSSGGNDNFYWDAIQSTVREQWASKTEAYTITSTDKYIWANATGGGFTVTLPAGADSLRGQIFLVKKTDSSANVVTIDGDGAETIEGSATVALSSQYDYKALTWTGTLWLIVGQN